MKKNEFETIMDDIRRGVEEVKTSDKFRNWLDTMSRFPNYSFNNIMLIYLQKPHATLVAGYGKWKQMGRQVNRGEKGITIIAPVPYTDTVSIPKTDPATNKQMYDQNGNPVMVKKEISRMSFRQVKVFDISQTSGRELPTIATELDGTVEGYQMMIEALKQASPVRVDFGKIEGRANGYFLPEENRIMIRDDMSEQQTVKTLIHEMAHAVLHAQNEENRDRQTEEIETEGTAYAVCRHYGIDTSDYSFGYITGWSLGHDAEFLRASLERIPKAAGLLIERIDSQREEILANDRDVQDPVFISNEEMKKYGYGWDGMLGMTREAAGLIQRMGGPEVYLLYPDNTEAVAGNEDDMNRHAEKGGLFGVERNEWTRFIQKTEQPEIKNKKMEMRR